MPLGSSKDERAWFQIHFSSSAYKRHPSFTPSPLHPRSLVRTAPSSNFALCRHSREPLPPPSCPPSSVCESRAPPTSFLNHGNWRLKKWPSARSIHLHAQIGDDGGMDPCARQSWLARPQGTPRLEVDHRLGVFVQGQGRGCYLCIILQDRIWDSNRSFLTRTAQQLQDRVSSSQSWILQCLSMSAKLSSKFPPF